MQHSYHIVNANTTTKDISSDTASLVKPLLPGRESCELGPEYKDH